jgi:hypothetical protein
VHSCGLSFCSGWPCLLCASWRACTWLTCRSTIRTCRLNPDCQVLHLLQRGKCLILCNPFDYITHVLCHVFTCFNRSFQPNPELIRRGFCWLKYRRTLWRQNMTI